MRDFEDELATMARREFPAAKDDPERLASMIARLMHTAGFTIAMATDGDAKAMSTLLIGAEAHLTESAAENAPVAQLLARLR